MAISTLLRHQLRVYCDRASVNYLDVVRGSRAPLNQRAEWTCIPVFETRADGPVVCTCAKDVAYTFSVTECTWALTNRWKYMHFIQLVFAERAPRWTKNTRRTGPKMMKWKLGNGTFVPKYVTNGTRMHAGVHEKIENDKQKSLNKDTPSVTQSKIPSAMEFVIHQLIDLAVFPQQPNTIRKKSFVSNLHKFSTPFKCRPRNLAISDDKTHFLQFIAYSVPHICYKYLWNNGHARG